MGWVPLDVSLANIYGKEFPLTDKNKKLVELTTATGYKDLDGSEVDYYFGNIDERRVVWSMGRDLVFDLRKMRGPPTPCPRPTWAIDGKQQLPSWTRESPIRKSR